MSVENCQKPMKIAAFHAVMLAALQFACSLNAAQPRLTEPAWSGGQFHFTLHGETNVGYLIESSTNLSAWTRVLTNTDAPAVRTITVPAADTQGFWRARAPLFQNAITATGTVTLGSSGWIESFDSADPNYSTGGQYDPAKQKAGGNIVTASGAVGAVSVGNMKVAGVVRTGPGGSVVLAPNGGVGSLAWLYNPANAGTFQPGYIDDDVVLSLHDGTLPNPFGPLSAPIPGAVWNGTNYAIAIGPGDWATPTINLSTSQKMLVRGPGRSRIYVTSPTNPILISGQAYILIEANASLEIYVNGSATIGGNGIVNGPSFAKDVSIVGLNGCTSVSYSGNSQFIGTIYAPRANVSLSGTSDAISALVGNTVTFSGGMGLHFDENLKRSGPF
jgi:hypothetical protein